MRAKSGGGRPSISSRKSALGEKRKKAASRKKSVPSEVTVSDEDIRLRAYLISEWRTQNGIAGDSARDWLEARRQLQEETSPRA